MVFIISLHIYFWKRRPSWWRDFAINRNNKAILEGSHCFCHARKTYMCCDTLVKALVLNVQYVAGCIMRLTNTSDALLLES